MPCGQRLFKVVRPGSYVAFFAAPRLSSCCPGSRRCWVQRNAIPGMLAVVSLGRLNIYGRNCNGRQSSAFRPAARAIAARD